MSADTKRHARTRRGCLTCRIRKKKCDSTRPSCTKCERLHVQCLGYASDRPDWLKGDNAKGYTQAIKCFLSEYPAAKAYDDPIPYLVLKSTSELEQSLTREPGRLNPFCFDPDNATLKRWLPSVPQPPPEEPSDVAFTTPGGEPPFYPAPTNVADSPYLPPTPSPATPQNYPALNVPTGSWGYAPLIAEQYAFAAPFIATQPTYGHSATQGIPASSYYDELESYPLHYVGGPIAPARQNSYTGSPRKTRFDEIWAPVNWLVY
ncbi:Fungal Zn, 2-cys(6) binuclear cluster domain containing protein [Ceratobasidium theobromae]|uniref:Fungal Zn, 2-cys(6) binuclear cluster domain containing protein n=1 Tax=Ceratobasidium theobromae TaxID=1582974 RepID=A0A5N5QUU1_9AGAM|nr:Fungal Zn, 2-cys(6) binuclear cluster domain containing protein [Ceratobasidium theobromae]